VSELAYQAAAQADTIYRAARRALNESQYRQAIELFEQSLDEEPEYSAEALYYQALAYYRIGGRSNYERALGKLDQQMERYPDSASYGDAEELTVRIEGELARRGDAQAAERLAREAERLAVSEEQRAQEHDEQAEREAEIKAMALHALIQADPEKAIPYLTKVLQNRTPETAELRGQAVFILGQHESEQTLDLMLDVVRNDPDPEVKAHAAFWLTQVDDPRAIDATIAIIEDPNMDEDIKGQAVFALGQTDDPRAGQILRDYATRSDVDPEIRGMAVHGLAQHPSPENAQLLKQMFNDVDDPEVREQILFALTQMPDAVDGDWLLAIFADETEDDEVREMALFMAGQTGNVDARVLSQMYDSAGDNQEMKEHILFTLTQLDSEAAFDKMLDIARNEEDPDLRQNAIFWIGQSGDPRAQDVLLEILDQ
ncbi:MAG: HEAT repeat domain-containing protein, partial [Gemmatimonadetes bacterium]|nr:HEAT repeat domain-containing protein [Gemmatimonadota bacterium]